MKNGEGMCHCAAAGVQWSAPLVFHPTKNVGLSENGINRPGKSVAPYKVSPKGSKLDIFKQIT